MKEIRLILDKDSTKFLLLLISADILFLILHFMHRVPLFRGFFPYFGNTAFSIFMDLGLAESYQYVKELWIIILLILVTIQTSKFVYLTWGPLFLYFFLDDMLKIHEDLGGFIARNFDYPTLLNMRAKDMGEFAVSVFFGLLFLILICAAYYLGDNQVKRDFLRLMILVAALFFFGVVVDMFDIAVHGVILKQFLGILEDFGEMLVISLLCWYVFVLSRWKRT